MEKTIIFPSLKEFEKILFLLKEGQKIIKIGEEYFSYKSFTPFSKDTTRNILVGSLVTDLIIKEEHLSIDTSYSQQLRQSLLENIRNRTLIKMEFSQNIVFFNFLPY